MLADAASRSGAVLSDPMKSVDQIFDDRQENSNSDYPPRLGETGIAKFLLLDGLYRY